MSKGEHLPEIERMNHVTKEHAQRCYAMLTQVEIKALPHNNADNSTGNHINCPDVIDFDDRKENDAANIGKHDSNFDSGD